MNLNLRMSSTTCPTKLVILCFMFISPSWNSSLKQICPLVLVPGKPPRSCRAKGKTPKLNEMVVIMNNQYSFLNNFRFGRPSNTRPRSENFTRMNLREHTNIT